jgi:hypothetical protein
MSIFLFEIEVEYSNYTKGRKEGTGKQLLLIAEANNSAKCLTEM